MATISIFQKYSNEENVLTNNILLFFSYVFRESNEIFSKLLSSITEDQFDVGPSIEQQVGVKNGIIDGRIKQEDWTILIETKLYENRNPDQLEKYITHLRGKSSNKTILISLNKYDLKPDMQKKLGQAIEDTGVLFVPLTFSNLLDEAMDIKEELPIGSELTQVIEEFELYLADGNHLNQLDRFPFFPCGRSLEENIIHKLYYEPVSRRLKNFDFMGIYKNREIQYVGKVQAVVHQIHEEGGVSYHIVKGSEGIDRNEAISRVKKVVEQTDYYKLETEDIRVYLFSEMINPRVWKSTKGGIQGMRYFYFTKKDEIRKLTDSPTLEVLSKLLENKTYPNV